MGEPVHTGGPEPFPLTSSLGCLALTLVVTRIPQLPSAGKPIIALPATAPKGTMSRIVPELKPGAGVVTARGHVHWVVTDFRAVNLHGKTLRERGGALISIAHPDFRSELRRVLANIRHFPMS